MGPKAGQGVVEKNMSGLMLQLRKCEALLLLCMSYVLHTLIFLIDVSHLGTS